MGKYKYTQVPQITCVTSEVLAHGVAAVDVAGMNFSNGPGILYHEPLFL